MNQRISFGLKTLNKTPSKKLTWAFMLSYLSIPLLALGILQLSIYDDPTEVFPKGHSYREGVKELKTKMNWAGDISVVFNSPLSTDDAKVIEEELLNLNGVHRIENFYNFSNDFIKLAENPLSKDRIKRELRNSSEAERYFSDSGSERWILYTSKIRSDELFLLSTQIKDLCKSRCMPAGSMDAYAEFASAVPETLLNSFLLSFFMVASTIVLLFKLKKPNVSILKVLPWLLASFWGPASILWLMSFFAIKVNYVTCIFVVILVGMTGDNTIQFLFGPKKNKDTIEADDTSIEDIKLKESASILCTILMSLGGLVFLFSYFEPPKIFGGLLFVGLMLSLWGDVWLLKGLLTKQSPQKAK